MDENRKIPTEFYYQEVFNTLLAYAKSSQEDTSKVPLRQCEVDKMKRRFIYQMNQEDISSQDCLKTLYSIALIANCDSEFPKDKDTIRKELINTITNHYLESRFSSFIENKQKIGRQLTVDLPRFKSPDILVLEGKRGKSDKGIRQVEQIFFDSYDTTLNRNPFFKKNKRTRKLVLRNAQKGVRYQAPNGKFKGMVAAGLTIFATAALSSLVLLPPTTPPAPTPTEEHTEIIDNSSEVNTALEYIYQNPSSLIRLGLPPEVSDQFAQYLKYRQRLEKGLPLTDKYQEEYESMGRFVVDAITSNKVSNAIGKYFSTYPDELNIQALNGLESTVTFRIGDNNYQFSEKNANDSNDLQASSLSMALYYRDEYLNNKKPDALYNAVNNALELALQDLTVDGGSETIVESPMHNIMNRLNSNKDKITDEPSR